VRPIKAIRGTTESTPATDRENKTNRIEGGRKCERRGSFWGRAYNETGEGGKYGSGGEESRN